MYNFEFGNAIIGLISAIIGGMIVLLGQWLQHKRETRDQKARDEGRKRLLRSMLDNPKFEWRQLTTMARVIGATENETALLLIEIGARGSEKDDGNWGYLKRHPLP